MADGTGILDFTPEVEAETATIYNRLRDKVSPIEWQLQAPLIAAINRLKREMNAVVLAHNYMTPDIFHGFVTRHCVHQVHGGFVRHPDCRGDHDQTHHERAIVIGARKAIRCAKSQQHRA